MIERFLIFNDLETIEGRNRANQITSKLLYCSCQVHVTVSLKSLSIKQDQLGRKKLQQQNSWQRAKYVTAV